MLNIYLLRHGETAYNADGNRYCGRTDISLTPKGIGQAELVRDQLAHLKFEAIYSSPLMRARITAEIASGRTPDTDDRLIEADFGTWEGKTKEEFIAENPTSWNNWMEDPGNTRAGGSGETGLEIVSRVGDFFTCLQKKHPQGNILVVAHNGVNRLFLASQLGMPLRNYRMIFQENSSITMFSMNHEGMTLRLLNSKL